MPVPVADTPEVAAARAAFFAAYNEAARAAASSPDNTWDSAAPAVQQQWSAPAPAPVQQQWSAPVEQTWAATPVNNWSRHATLGVVEVDTPEIAAAKQAFFIAYNEAARAAASSPDNTWDSPAPAVQQQWSAPAPAPVQQQWSAPVEQTWAATPVNNWSRHATLGVVEVDTPEIAAAKQAFFIAYNAAARAAAESPEN